ncbi:MAG: NAD-dependent epimerase/dehydratase family protein [Pelotomaculum sp.]
MTWIKKVLILGGGGYIGSHIAEWLKAYSGYSVQTVNMKAGNWKSLNFGDFDSVVDTAGIAHIQPKEELKDLFYSVNTNLTIELCEKAKDDGARQFIFLSSKNVFGDHCGIIHTVENPQPSSFYGDSKLQADLKIQAMNSASFKVVSIRPPAVYGKGCKGNFPTLIKYAKIMPIFPDYAQKKSMIYIDNLCEFVRLLIDNDCSGVFHPQNREYTSTTEMVRAITKAIGRKICFTKIFNLLLRLSEKKIRIVNRAFSDDAYKLDISSLL